MTRDALASAVLVLAVAAGARAQTTNGQTTSAPGKGTVKSTKTAGGVPRTAWGDPDIQGVWDYWTFTPLERPKEFASKATLSDAEYVDLVLSNNPRKPLW
jgi:hypothetical protein